MRRDSKHVMTKIQQTHRQQEKRDKILQDIQKNEQSGNHFSLSVITLNVN